MRLTRSFEPILAQAMATEPAELGRESTLQELLNEISSAGKLGIKLEDATDRPANTSKALLKGVWTAVELAL